MNLSPPSTPTSKRKRSDGSKKKRNNLSDENSHSPEFSRATHGFSSSSPPVTPSPTSSPTSGEIAPPFVQFSDETTTPKRSPDRGVSPLHPHYRKTRAKTTQSVEFSSNLFPQSVIINSKKTRKTGNLITADPIATSFSSPLNPSIDSLSRDLSPPQTLSPGHRVRSPSPPLNRLISRAISPHSPPSPPSSPPLRNPEALRPPLLALLQNETTLSAMITSMEEEDFALFSTHFCGTCAILGIAIPAITAITNYEVQKQDDPTDLFTNLKNSLPSSLLVHFITTLSQPYLPTLFATFLYSQTNNSELDLEALDGLGSRTPQNLTLTESKIESAYIMFLRILLGSVDFIPQELKLALHEIGRKVREKFGEEAGRRVVVSVFVGRVVGLGLGNWNAEEGACLLEVLSKLLTLALFGVEGGRREEEEREKKGGGVRVGGKKGGKGSSGPSTWGRKAAKERGLGGEKGCGENELAGLGWDELVGRFAGVIDEGRELLDLLGGDLGGGGARDENDIQREAFFEFARNCQEPEDLELGGALTPVSIQNFGKLFLFRSYHMKEKIMELDISSEQMETSLDVISGLKQSVRRHCPDLAVSRFSSSKQLLNASHSSDFLLPKKKGTGKASVKRTKSQGAQRYTKRDAPSSLTKKSPLSLYDDFDFAPLSQLLKNSNHALALGILSTLASIHNPPPNLDELIFSVLHLHTNAEELFMIFFKRELQAVKSVAVVMRESGPTVCVLRYLLGPSRERGWGLIKPLVKFGGKLGKKADIMLGEGGEEGEGEVRELKVGLLKIVTKLLVSADSLPPGLCVLCYQCVEAVRKNKNAIRLDGTPLAHWAVGAVIFLRFFCPMVTEFAINHPNIEPLKKKGLTFVGRFLMKLCCKTVFLQSGAGCVANELLRECTSFYDEFCEQVVQIGKESAAAGVGVLDSSPEERIALLGELPAGWRADLAEFLKGKKMEILDRVPGDNLPLSFVDDSSSRDIIGFKKKIGVELDQLTNKLDNMCDEFDLESEFPLDVEGGRTNRLRDRLEKVTLMMEGKGRIFVAILGGSDLRAKSYYAVIEFEDQKYFSTSKAGPITEWNEEFSFIVKELASKVTVHFYESHSSGKWWKGGGGDGEAPLASFSIAVDELPVGEVKRLVMDIPFSKAEKKGIIYFHMNFEQDLQFSHYLCLEKLIIRKKFRILECLCAHVMIEDAAWLSGPVLSMLVKNERILPFLRRAIKKVISGTKSIDLLFRGQNLVIKILSQYTNLVGKHYLISLLQPFLENLFEEVEGLDLQFDQQKMQRDARLDMEAIEEPTSVLKNKENGALLILLKFTNKLLNAIFSSFSGVPLAIVTICGYLRRYVLLSFNEGIPQVLSGFLFLRFICPALASPETVSGLVQTSLSSHLRSFLVLMAKIVQNVASLVEFGEKEDYLTCCNPFIRQTTPKIMDFYHLMSEQSSVSSPALENGGDREGMTGGVMQRHHYHSLHVAIVKYDVVDLLPEKEDELRLGLEMELSKLDKPMMNERAVEMIGFVDLERIAEDMRDLENGIQKFGLHSEESKKQKSKGKNSKKPVKVFSAYDLIDWFCVSVPICQTREDAVILGNRMLEFNFILRASPHTLSFTDSIEMFELSEGGGAGEQGGRCVLNNIQQVLSNVEEKDVLEGEEEICAFSKDLLETVGSLIKEGSALVENEIRAAMLTNIRDNPKFKIFALSTTKLQTLSPQELKDQKSKISFWLNIYHCLLLHAAVERGYPSSSSSVPSSSSSFSSSHPHLHLPSSSSSSSSRGLAKFLQTSCYSIGGVLVSLNDIESILKGGGGGGGGKGKFGKKDPRGEYVVGRRVALVGLVLSWGCLSCPPIYSYTPGGLTGQLQRCAVQFLGRWVKVEKKGSGGGGGGEGKGRVVVKVPKVVVGFGRDVGEDKRGVVGRIAGLLGREKERLEKDKGEKVEGEGEGEGGNGREHLCELLKELEEALEDPKTKFRFELLPFDSTFSCNLSLLD